MLIKHTAAECGEAEWRKMLDLINLETLSLRNL